MIHWWDQVGDGPRPPHLRRPFPDRQTEHASITETSMLEFLLPELVRPDQKADGGADAG